MDLLDELQSQIIPGDGAMGTMLIDAGISMEHCLEEVCVSNPEHVTSIHEQYISAGARVIRTNSFGSNSVRLEKHGFANRVNEFNWVAARLAKDVARGKRVYVSGSVGPLGMTKEESSARGINRRTVYQEQIGALLDGGVDLISFETFFDFDDLALVLDIKQSLHHCPAICSIACPPEGRLAGGMPIGDAFAKLLDLGAEIVGVNCVDASSVPKLLQVAPAGSFVSAYPNGGQPVFQDARFHYAMTPDAFAEAGRSLASEGANLIGGCCGTRPEHIAALVEALRDFQPVTRNQFSER